MQWGGAMTGSILSQLLVHARPGVTTAELDCRAETLIKKSGGEPSFKTVTGYHFSICTTVGDQVVHGIPGAYRLEAGDVVGIDIGVFYKGFHTDAAWTIVVPGNTTKANAHTKDFLKTGVQALKKAIAGAYIGNTIGDIGYAIGSTVEEAGFSVVREFIGHGVGRSLHEDPPIPGFAQPGTGEKLREGMTLAIEVIYTMGKPDVVIMDDGWTVVTKDHSIAGLFEHSVAITTKGPLILTEGAISGRL